MSHIRQKTIDGISPGNVFRVTRTFSEDETRRFGEITRDYNPVHYDDRFSSAKGFPARICHGLLVAGIITEIGGQIGWLASGMNFHFMKPVFFGDTVTCAVTILSVDDNGRARATAAYTNQRGEKVLAAELNGYLPGEREREILRAMVAEGDPTNRIK
ncbi:MAG: MaoC family dehydratase [Spirochaetes bacterium]|nr:MaoC family dehydratase [Spirochaetota bacterium]